MAISRTALSTGANKTGTTINFNTTTNVIVDDIIAVIVASDVALTSVKYFYDGTNEDGAFTLAANVTNSGNVVSSIYTRKAVNASNGGKVEVVPASGALAVAVSIIRGASDLDKSAGTTGTGTSPSSGATATTTQANEILIGCIGTEGSQNDTAGTWSNSFNNGQRVGTTGGGGASNITVSEGYLIVSATGAYTAAKTGITSADWAAVILTIKEAATATPINQTASDTISNQSDTAVIAYGLTGKPADTINAYGENVEKLFGYRWQPAEQLSLSDANLKIFGHLLPFSDTLVQSDNAQNNLNYLLSFSDRTFGKVYTDDFNRASLGSDWSNSGIQLNSNKITAFGSGTAYYTAADNEVNQLVAFDIIDFATSSTITLFARYNLSTSNGYAVKFVGEFSSYVATIVRYDSGTTTDLTSTGTLSASSGDKFKLSVENNQIKVYVNSTLILETTDSNHVIGGQTGVFINCTPLTTNLDNFELIQRETNLDSIVTRLLGLQSQSFSDTISQSDAFSLIYGHLLPFAESLNVQDAINLILEYRLLFGDITTQLDDIVVSLNGVSTELTISQVDQIVLSDQLRLELAYLLSFSDQTAQNDSIQLIFGYLKGIADALSQSDSLNLVFGSLLNLSDTLSQNDSLAANFSYLTNFSDQLLQNDSFANLLGNLLGFSDAIGQTDATSPAIGFLLTRSDTLTFSDDLAKILGVALQFSDLLQQNDNLEAFLRHFLLVADSLNQQDEIKLNLHYRLAEFSDFLQQNDSASVDLLGFILQLSRLFADTLIFSDDIVSPILVPFLQGIFTVGELMERVRQTIDNPVFWTPQDIQDSLQDGYDEIVASSGALLKTAVLPFEEKLIYYDFKSLIPDLVAITSIYNTVTREWLKPRSLLAFNDFRSDWETIDGQPEFFSVVSYRYTAIHPRTSLPDYGNMFVMYRASAQSLAVDDTIKFNSDFITALEEYAAMDLLEQQQEWTKASLRFKNYLDLSNRLEVWAKSERQPDREPRLKP